MTGPEPAREGILVLRLWSEPQDPSVRARLLVRVDDEPGTPLLGVDQIVIAVEAAVQAFTRGDLPSWRDGPETLPRR